MAAQTVVPIKSAWASKINWTQAGGAASVLVTAFGLDLSDPARAKVSSVLAIATFIITWIQRTWFTTAVTAASVEN